MSPSEVIYDWIDLKQQTWHVATFMKHLLIHFDLATGDMLWHSATQRSGYAMRAYLRELKRKLE